jgi:hypothetical protein
VTQARKGIQHSPSPSQLHRNIADPNSADGFIDQKKEAFRPVRDELHDKFKQFVTDIAQMEPSQLSIA